MCKLDLSTLYRNYTHFNKETDDFELHPRIKTAGKTWIVAGRLPVGRPDVILYLLN